MKARWSKVYVTDVLKKADCAGIELNAIEEDIFQNWRAKAKESLRPVVCGDKVIWVDTMQALNLRKVYEVKV